MLHNSSSLQSVDSIILTQKGDKNKAERGVGVDEVNELVFILLICFDQRGTRYMPSTNRLKGGTTHQYNPTT